MGNVSVHIEGVRGGGRGGRDWGNIKRGPGKALQCGSDVFLETGVSASCNYHHSGVEAPFALTPGCSRCLRLNQLGYHCCFFKFFFIFKESKYWLGDGSSRQSARGNDLLSFFAFAHPLSPAAGEEPAKKTLSLYLPCSRIYPVARTWFLLLISPLFFWAAHTHTALACKSRTSGRVRVSCVVLLAAAVQGFRGRMMGHILPRCGFR